MEIPEDIEIEQVAFDEAQKDWLDLKFEKIYRDAFIDGAKWMKHKIIKQKRRVL